MIAPFRRGLSLALALFVLSQASAAFPRLRLRLLHQ